MTADEIRQGLKVLRNYYAKDGQPHALNDTQLAVYLDGLSPFAAAELERAARTWMQQSRWFPALSDLLALVRPPALDPAAAAQLAWTTFERAMRRAGAYRGVTFADGAIGETVRQVFGTWAAASQFDVDSPGWAIRRQSFLALYATFASRVGGPVTLYGIHRDAVSMLVGHVEGLPTLPAASGEDDLRELSPAEASAAWAAITQRFAAERGLR